MGHQAQYWANGSHPERSSTHLASSNARALTFISPLQIHYIDVGTGDCIWIRTGDDGIPGNGRHEGLTILIDGGGAPRFGRENGYKSASQHLTENDKLPMGKTIGWLILSHPHSGHCGGLDNFLDDYDVLYILDPGHDPLNADGIPASQRPNSMYGKFFNKAATEISNGTKANFVWGIPGDLTLDWGGELEVKILHPSTTVIDHDLNNTSIVLSVGFADPDDGPTFLFTGDGEEAVEEALVASLDPRPKGGCSQCRSSWEQIEFNRRLPGDGPASSHCELLGKSSPKAQHQFSGSILPIDGAFSCGPQMR